MNDMTIVLFQQLIAEVRGLRHDLAERNHGAAIPPQTERLLETILESVRGRSFTSSELADFIKLPEFMPLEFAVRDSVGETNAKSLGKFFRKIEGHRIGNFAVERVGTDRQGIIWHICKFGA